MLFNSFTFIIFFLIVYLFHLLCPKKHWKIEKIFLFLASCIFYAWWKLEYLPLILLVVLINYFAGSLLNKVKEEKRFFVLVISVICNLGVLVYFKYTNFILTSVNEMFTAFQANKRFDLLNIILPIGISFYTFQGMSYTIDIYRKKIAPVSTFLDFAFFLTLFPQLVAGPIVRAIDFLPQINKKKSFRWPLFYWGAFLIIIGYFKKIVITDNITGYVDLMFSSNVNYKMAIYYWLAVYQFAIQIYCDFSGYSDIAIGIGLLLGFRFKNNFNYPYIAKNFSDFWERWHISLSSWLRDYLYIPLGGNRKGKRRTYLNLIATMLLGGLWHGANWTFVIWGLIHGIYLIFQRVAANVKAKILQKLKGSFLYSAVSTLVVFHFVCITWVFFRASDFTKAFQILRAMFSFNHFFSYFSSNYLFRHTDFLFLLPILIMHIYVFFNFQFFKIKRLPATIYFALSAGMILSIIFLNGKANAFIYFQF